VIEQEKNSFLFNILFGFYVVVIAMEPKLIWIIHLTNQLNRLCFGDSLTSQFLQQLNEKQ